MNQHPKIAIKDVPIGAVFVVIDQFGPEVRETYYVRDPDRACRHHQNVPVARLGAFQGENLVGSEPRYKAVLKEPCRDPGEADGRVLVELLDFHHLWSDYLEAPVLTLPEIKF